MRDWILLLVLGLTGVGMMGLLALLMVERHTVSRIKEDHRKATERQEMAQATMQRQVDDAVHSLRQEVAQNKHVHRADLQALRTEQRQAWGRLVRHEEDEASVKSPLDSQSAESADDPLT